MRSVSAHARNRQDFNRLQIKIEKKSFRKLQRNLRGLTDDYKSRQHLVNSIEVSCALHLSNSRL